MKTKLTIHLILFGILLSSCNRILDIDSKEYQILTDNYYSTKSELNYALNGVYAMLADASLYGGNMMGRMGLEADEAYSDYNTDENTVGNYGLQTTDVKVRNYWKACYTGINRANFLLYNVDNPNIDIDNGDRNSIKGEALTLRAYYYLMLVTRFQGVPLILKPIETTDVGSLQLPKSTGREIYGQIIVDLALAETLVKSANEVESGGRISKSAVWGLLARTNLYLAGNPYNEPTGYEEAKRYAEKVMNSGYHYLNNSYRQVFVNYAQDLYDIHESIWEVEFFSDGTGVIPAYGSVGRYNGIGNSAKDDVYGFSFGVLRSTSYLYELYHTGDLRRDWAIADHNIVTNNGVSSKSYWTTGTTFQRHCGKFRRESEIIIPKMDAGTPQNFPLIRYADVLLMYAEASNEVNHGADSEAREALNKVKRRAYGFDQTIPNPSVDFASSDYESFKKEVREERPRELCFETLRKNDVVRWNTFYGNMKAREVEIPPTDNAYLNHARAYFGNVERREEWWPIPAYEIGVNKKLVQNIGW